MIGVGGIKLQGVIVNMNSPGNRRDRFAAVVRDMDAAVNDINALELMGVAVHFPVILGVHHAVIVLPRPGDAAVGGFEEAALAAGSGDVGIDEVGVLRGDGQGDAPQIHGGNAVGYFAPGGPGIFGLEQARLGTAADEKADVAAALVGGGEKDIGIARVHDDFGDAGVFADGEDGFPGLAAVGGFVEAAVAAGRPKGTLGGDIDDLGIARVNKNSLDVLGVFQAGAGPGLAGIGALVDAVAEADAAQGLVFAGAEPDDVGVLGINGDAAQGVGAALIKDRLEGKAVVLGFPKAAGGGGDVPNAVVLQIHGDVLDAAGKAGGAEAAQFQAAKGLRRERDGGGLIVSGAGGENGGGVDDDESQACQKDGSGFSHKDFWGGQKGPNYSI